MKGLRSIIIGAVIPVIVLSGWYYATVWKGVPASILPRIPDVGRACIKLLANGSLQKDVGISLKRVMQGYLIAAAFGLLAGSLMGITPIVKELLLLPMTLIRQVPIVAWIPLIILWCGIGELSKVVIIVIAAAFPIILNTWSGVQDTPYSFVEVAKLYNMSKLRTFFKVYLPHALPQILVGLKLGMGSAFMAVVTAEVLGASVGIGYRLSEARSMMRSDQVILCILVIGLIGIVIDKLLSALFRWLTPWQKSENEKKR